MNASDASYGYVVGPDRKFCGVVSQKSLQQALARSSTGKLSDAYIDASQPIRSNVVADQVVRRVARSACPLPVVDESNRYMGVVSKSALLECFDRREEQA
jgi:glycine betaine/proline transport system ATP-binding protein